MRKMQGGHSILRMMTHRLPLLGITSLHSMLVLDAVNSPSLGQKP